MVVGWRLAYSGGSLTGYVKQAGMTSLTNQAPPRSRDQRLQHCLSLWLSKFDNTVVAGANGVSGGIEVGLCRLTFWDLICAVTSARKG
jgi:SNF family Na+-dependent transporter